MIKTIDIQFRMKVTLTHTQVLSMKHEKHSNPLAKTSRVITGASKLYIKTLTSLNRTQHVTFKTQVNRNAELFLT